MMNENGNTNNRKRPLQFDKCGENLRHVPKLRVNAKFQPTNYSLATKLSSLRHRALSNCIRRTRGHNVTCSFDVVSRVTFVGGSNLISQVGKNFNLISVESREDELVHNSTVTFTLPDAGQQSYQKLAETKLMVDDYAVPSKLYRIDGGVLHCSTISDLFTRSKQTDGRRTAAHQIRNSENFTVLHNGDLIHTLTSKNEGRLFDTRVSWNVPVWTTSSIKTSTGGMIGSPILTVMDDDIHIVYRSNMDSDRVVDLFDTRVAGKKLNSLVIGTENSNLSPQWDHVLERFEMPFALHQSKIHSVTAAGTSMILTSDIRGRIKLWDLSTMQGIQTYNTLGNFESDMPIPVAVCPDTKSRFYTLKPTAPYRQIVEYSLLGGVPSAEVVSELDMGDETPAMDGIATLTMNTEGSALAAGYRYANIKVFGVH